jgi:hypothetical protein
MGLLSRINDLWSQADRWDKKENQQQSQDAARRREEERKRREAEAARRRAEAEALRAQREASQRKTIEGLTSANKSQQPTQQAPKTVSESPADIMNVADRLRAGQDTLLFKPELVNQAKKQIHSEQSNATKVKNVVMGAGTGFARFGASGLQAGGGLYDLATLGKGRNRVAKFGDKYAELADQVVKENDFNSKVYHGTQIAAELAMGAGTGAIAKQAVVRSPKLAGMSTKIDDIINSKIKGTSVGARGTRAALREAASPEAVASEAYFANKQIGETAGRDQQVTPERALMEYGFAIPGAATSVAINKGIKQLMPAGSVSPFFNQPSSKPTVNEAVNQAAEGVPVDRPVSVAPGVSSNNLQKKLNNVAQQVAENSNRPPVSAGTPPIAPDVPAPTPPVDVPRPITNPRPEPPQPVAPPEYVPPAPQTINPEIQKALEAAAVQVDEATVAPQASPDLPELAPVETPIVAQSRAMTPTPVVDEATIRAEKLDSLRAERQAMKDAGVDTKDIDAQIKALSEAPEEAVSSSPASVRADDYGSLAESARNSKNIVEWREKTQTDLIDANGRMKDPVTGEDISAKQFFDNARATTRADDLVENAGIDPVTTEPIPELRLKTQAQKDAHEKARVDAVKRAEAETAAKARAKTVVEVPETTTPVSSKTVKPDVAQSSELPRKPVLNREQLQKEARNHVTQAGTVSKAWVKQQLRAGADILDVHNAVEKVEGRKAPKTEQEKLTKAQRDKLNAQARENKKQAQAEGRTKEAAPEFTKSQSRKAVKETGQEKLGAATARLSKAYVKGVNLEAETKAAADEVSKVSDGGMIGYIEKTLTDSGLSDDPRLMFKGDAILQRLDDMLVKKKISEDDMLDLAAKIVQSQAARTSKSGQVQRITRELYQRVPAPIRVQRELDKMIEHFDSLNKKFTPTKADRTFLTKQTREFDQALVDIKAAEANMQMSMASVLDTKNPMTAKQLAEADAAYKNFDKARTEAQERAVKSTETYLERMESIKPDLTFSERAKSRVLGAPDTAGNYLRMSMLSAPSGRIRDAFSTTFNVVDQMAWRTAESVIGRVANKTVGSDLLESLGSGASRAKGRAGAWEKLKASYHGKNTLDEATGRTGTTDRGELKDSLSVFKGNKSSKPHKPGKLRSFIGTPKRIIRAGVQAPTDLSYGIYTDRLYAHGMQQAKKAGLEGDRAKLYARMFMEQPDAASVKDAARVWLENSGMHDNFISQNLTKFADFLDQAGGPTSRVGGDSKRQRGVTERTAIKSVARVIRTTTIPFVQYMGGATHAMVINQNPLVNAGKFLDEAFLKKNPQAAVEQLARGGWNTAKIGTLVGAIAAGKLEISDTDASGENAYNAPYVVNEDGTHVPASTFGIAAGSAIISAHYINKAIQDLKDGDIAGAFGNSTGGPFWATIKASGMDNMLSGQNVLGGMPATLGLISNNPKKEGKDLNEAAFGGLLGDLGTQSVPAVFRDIDSYFNQKEWYNPTGEAPDTSGKDPVTGKVNPLQKGIDRIKGGVPFLSDDLPRKSGSNARTFSNRVFNADKQSDQQRAAISSKQQEETRVMERNKAMFANKDIVGMLSEETRAIHDKYKGNFEKASADDLSKIWTEAKKGKGKLLEDGKYKSHAEILKYELGEMEAKGNVSATDISKQKRKITRSEIADKNKIDSQIFRMYTGEETAEGGGISQRELNKMLDDESEYYDPKTAAALLELDRLFTEAGVSSNSNGIDPWKRPKYREPDNGWGGSKKGRGRGKGSARAPATNFGTLGSFAKPMTGVGQKYQRLASLNNVLPNLTSESSKTNLKKKISIQKGVKI